MVARVSYEVIASPAGGGWWSLEVPAVGRVTQARNTREIVPMAQDLIGVMTGDVGAKVEVTYSLPTSITEDLERAAAAHVAAASARAEAAARLRSAARALRREQHLTLADVGVVLGVSHQRAHQLTSA